MTIPDDSLNLCKKDSARKNVSKMIFIIFMGLGVGLVLYDKLAEKRGWPVIGKAIVFTLILFVILLGSIIDATAGKYESPNLRVISKNRKENPSRYWLKIFNHWGLTLILIIIVILEYYYGFTRRHPFSEQFIGAMLILMALWIIVKRTPRLVNALRSGKYQYPKSDPPDRKENPSRYWIKIINDLGLIIIWIIIMISMIIIIL